MTADQASYTAGVRDETFYIETLTFWVEGTLFKIPRLYFERTSGVFGDMFSLSSGSDNHKQEGSSDDNPIRLDGIENIDFRRLLWVMFPDLNRFAKNRITMGQKEWTSVLKLSTLWSMGELRQEAIEALSQMTIDPIDKVLLARDYKVGPWLVEAYTELVKREEMPTFADSEKLGWKTAYAIVKAREDSYKSVSLSRDSSASQALNLRAAPTITSSYCQNCQCYRCNIHNANNLVQSTPTHRYFDNLESRIRDTFKDELKDVEYGGDAIIDAALEVLSDFAEKLEERKTIALNAARGGHHPRGRGWPMGSGLGRQFPTRPRS